MELKSTEKRGPDGDFARAIALQRAAAIVELVRHYYESRELEDLLLAREMATGRRALPDGLTWPMDVQDASPRALLCEAVEYIELTRAYLRQPA